MAGQTNRWTYRQRNPPFFKKRKNKHWQLGLKSSFSHGAVVMNMGQMINKILKPRDRISILMIHRDVNLHLSSLMTLLRLCPSVCLPLLGERGERVEWKISPFYRTLSPIGDAALPPPIKTKEKVEQGKRTADHLMPVGDWLRLDNMKEAVQGNS